MHDFVTGLDNFQRATGTDFEDLYEMLPKNFRTQADLAFKKLSETNQVALKDGIKAGYDTFLQTGSLAIASKDTAATGLLSAGRSDANVGTGMGFLQTMFGRSFQQERMGSFGDVFSENLTKGFWSYTARTSHE